MIFILNLTRHATFHGHYVRTYVRTYADQTPFREGCGRLRQTPRARAKLMSVPKSNVRKVLHYTVHLPVSRKAPTLMAILSLLSLVAWVDLSPQCPYLSDKRNTVNSLLVKWSWGWSLLCLGPSVMLTAFIYSALQWRQVLYHFSRLLVAHCIWLSATQAFIFLDSAVGVCSDGSDKDRTDCLQGEGSWEGFDISGHVFLLTYCVYVLTEEVAGLKWEVWSEFDGSLELEHTAMDKLGKASEILPHIHFLCSPLAAGLELFAAALMTLWITMTIITSLYFHSVTEKLLGGVCGWLGWLLTYGCVYGKAYMPRRPEQGLLHPLRHSSQYHETID